jgi:hypothetical protein
MNNSALKVKLRKKGYRVTKNVNGKRVPLNRNEMLKKLGNKSNNNKHLNREVHRVRKFIKVCKLILTNMNNVKSPNRKSQNKKNNNNRVVVRPSPPRASVPRPPTRPPPPPPVPVSQNPRAALMANLKANLKRRGLSN